MTIDPLADALEAERAKVAAAYEAAAKWLIGTGIAGDGDGDPLASCIRALTPADAQAALDKLLTEARLEGWRAAIDAAARVANMFGQGAQGIKASETITRHIRALPEPKEASQ